MRTLPHIVIGCGTVWGGSRLVDRLRGRREAREVAVASSGSPNGSSGDAPTVARTSDAIDYRFVALGSLLPDLVERALRRTVFRCTVDANEHTLGHTLLLNLGVLIAGLRLGGGSGDARFLSVGMGAMTHLLVDPVMRAPRTLFWPLLGFRFPQLRGLGTLPTIASQVAAGTVVLGVAQALVRRGHLRRFLSSGRL